MNPQSAKRAIAHLSNRKVPVFLWGPPGIGKSSVVAQIAKEKGIDLIITDHHTVGEQIPYAYAIINPKQEDCNFEFKDICGAQVAWYLCANIKKALAIEFNLLELFDLLTIAVVADVMPMISLIGPKLRS